MKYHCEFPNCTYETNQRSHIHIHHIIPREFGGCDKKWNKIFLCPNCHATKIFVPNSSGIHSYKTKETIVIKGWRISTGGRMLEYIDANGEVCYFQNAMK